MWRCFFMKRTKDLVLMAMYIALYIVLEWMMAVYPLFAMPQGGKLGISAIPLILASYQLGVGKGLIVVFASLLGRFMMIKVPTFVSPLQLFMDYFFAYGVYSFSVLFKDIKISDVKLPIGVIFTNIIRYLAHSFSGIFFFPSGENMQAIIMGSLIYNMPYMLATTVITFVIIMIAKPRLERV